MASANLILIEIAPQQILIGQQVRLSAAPCRSPPSRGRVPTWREAINLEGVSIGDCPDLSTLPKVPNIAHKPDMESCMPRWKVH